MDLETYEEQKAEPDKLTKPLKAVREFRSDVETNGGHIPNYGERYRYCETISSAFVESTIN